MAMNEAYTNRFDKLRRRMRETGTDMVALGPGSHMDWLLGFHPYPDERPCLLLVGQEKAAFVMPALNAEANRPRTDIPFCVWRDQDDPRTALADAMKKSGAGAARKVALDEEMRADFARLMTEQTPDAEQHFCDDTVGFLRMRKEPEEIALMKASAAVADRAVLKAFSEIRAGQTELELAGIINGHFVSEGATPLFCIVGSSGNGAYPHHNTGHRKFRRGDPIVIDIGARKDGYPSDITRMAVIEEVPEGYDELHAVVEAAVNAALAAARPGARARDVDSAARSVIEAAGYGDFFVHRTGHGIGIKGHEQPFITGASDIVLEENMTFSIEPGIYLPGRFGIRLEEIVVLRADGPEILSGLPRDLRIVTPDGI